MAKGLLKNIMIYVALGGVFITSFWYQGQLASSTAALSDDRVIADSEVLGDQEELNKPAVVASSERSLMVATETSATRQKEVVDRQEARRTELLAEYSGMNAGQILEHFMRLHKDKQREQIAAAFFELIKLGIVAPNEKLPMWDALNTPFYFLMAMKPDMSPADMQALFDLGATIQPDAKWQVVVSNLEQPETLQLFLAQVGLSPQERTELASDAFAKGNIKLFKTMYGSDPSLMTDSEFTASLKEELRPVSRLNNRVQLKQQFDEIMARNKAALSDEKYQQVVENQPQFWQRMIKGNLSMLNEEMVKTEALLELELITPDARQQLNANLATLREAIASFADDDPSDT